MELEEANKVIAEFMGLKVKRVYYSALGEWMLSYEDSSVDDGFVSLDALVPVWEKMELFWEGIGHRDNNTVDINVMPDGEFVVIVGNQHGWKPTIQEAACIATARAIKELNEVN